MAVVCVCGAKFYFPWTNNVTTTCQIIASNRATYLYIYIYGDTTGVNLKMLLYGAQNYIDYAAKLI